MSGSDNTQKKRNNYKLLVDPELRKGHKKLYRLNGKDVPGVRRSLIRTQLPCRFCGCKKRRARLWSCFRELLNDVGHVLRPCRCPLWVSPKTRGRRRLFWECRGAAWSWPYLASRSAFLSLSLSLHILPDRKMVLNKYHKITLFYSNACIHPQCLEEHSVTTLE